MTEELKDKPSMLDLARQFGTEIADPFLAPSKFLFSIGELENLCRAALSAPDAGGVPPGWKLVPLEPTREMIVAAMGLDLSYMPTQAPDDRGCVYRAMLAAAPVCPAPAPDVARAHQLVGTLKRRAGALSLEAADLSVGKRSAYFECAQLLEAALSSPEPSLPAVEGDQP